MKNKALQILKDTKSKTLELVITTVLIASGINLIIFGVCSLTPEANIYVLILIGIALITLSIGFVLHKGFIQSYGKRIVNAVILYDKQNKSILNIPNYKFAEDIYKCLNSAISEDSNIKGMWLHDELGLTSIFNNVSPDATYIALSRSGALLNQLIEYLVLNELSILTTDYFNSPNFNKRKIRSLKRVDVGDLIASNEFLNLFSKPTYERAAFDNKASKMVYGYGKDGAIYDRFELFLPVKCKISRSKNNIIIINHPYFKLSITPAFTGLGEVVPTEFIKKYLKQDNINNISCFKVWIGIDLKFSWRAFFMDKTEYYEWIDNYFHSIMQYASFEDFFNKIQWNIIEAILRCGK